MTSKNEEDYQHSNRAGTGPAKRMTGGDQTDEIDINDPRAPHKKYAKKCLTEPPVATPQPREAALKDDSGILPSVDVPPNETGE